MVYQNGIPVAMRITLSVKLSMKNDRHRQIAKALQQESSVSGAIAAILEYYYFEREAENKPIAVVQDNSDVLAAIAELSRKLDSIAVTHSPPRGVHDVPTREAPIYTEADLDIPADTIVAIKKAARPGMRME